MSPPGERIATFGGRVRSMSFSPDGKTLAAGADDGKIYLWDVETRTVRTVLTGHAGSSSSDAWVFSVSFSPDGKTLASGGNDGTVRLWNLVTGGQIAVLTGHIRYVNRVSFGRDGKTLASFSLHDKTVVMWDLVTRLPKFTISGYQALNRSLDQYVSFSPDGKTLASIGSDDGAIHLWDVTSGRQRAALNGCGVGEYIASANFSPDGKTLASGGSDHMLRLWDVDSGREITFLKHDSGVRYVSFSPDGKTLASEAGGEVHLWNVDSWGRKSVLSHYGGVNSVSFSPDGRTFATTGRDDTGEQVYLWDVNTGKQIGVLVGHAKPITSVSFSPSDGVILASSGYDGAFLWDVAARKKIATLTLEAVKSVNFSPDRDSKILAGGGFGTVRLWNVEAPESPEEIAVLNSDSDSYDLSFSPNGKKLAGVIRVGHYQGTIRLWDIDTGTEIATFPGYGDGASSVSFSPDSGTLASMGYDNATVHLWDIATGKEKIRLTRHTGGSIHGRVSFSPDSEMLASGGGDGAVRLWDCRNTHENRGARRTYLGRPECGFQPG